MIKFKEYEVLEDMFNDDIMVCGEVFNYDENMFLCDVISEIAYDSVSIFNADLSDKCFELNRYVVEAKEEGLLESFSDLFDLLRVGAYQYYLTLLYNNLDTLMLNIAINYLNNNYNEQYLNELDTCELSEICKELDDGVTIEEIEEITREFMDKFIESLEK